MATLTWLPEAVKDLAHLLAALGEKSPEAACRAAQMVRGAAERLEESSALGRPMMDGTGRRELLIPFASAPQMLRYRLGEAGEIVVIRVQESGEAPG